MGSSVFRPPAYSKTPASTSRCTRANSRPTPPRIAPAPNGRRRRSSTRLELPTRSGAQFIQAARLSYQRFQTLLGDDYGVRWIENYDCHDAPASPFLSSAPARLIPDLYPEVKTFGPGDHPFPTRYATRALTMLIEPNRYLRALERDVLEHGGRIVVRSFASASELVALDEPLIMNCTGLGARGLTGDTQLEPVRGQLSVLAPQPAVDYITLHGGRYMFPRTDGIVLGGTFQHGDTNLAIDPAQVARIVGEHAAFFEAMRR